MSSSLRLKWSRIHQCDYQARASRDTYLTPTIQERRNYGTYALLGGEEESHGVQDGVFTEHSAEACT